MKTKTEIILSCTLLCAAWLIYPHTPKSSASTALASPSPSPSSTPWGQGADPGPSPTPPASPNASTTPAADPSTTDPASLWVIVNKHHPLPLQYVPVGLRSPKIPLKNGSGTSEMLLRDDAAAAAESFIGAADAAGYKFMLVSGYRSSELQTSLYARYVADNGQTEADTFSARPGFSEHQTGLSMDVSFPDNNCSFAACQGDTPGGKWLETEAYKYGFILRYPRGKQSITGYIYEPWHFRYVGIKLASELHTQEQTMEEFFSLEPATTYP
jgi:zinc D-Ala-D-Ala carboxypeptidase